MLEQLSGGDDAHEDVADIAHKIAGLAGSLGYPDLSTAAADLETLLVHGVAPKLADAPEFHRLMNRIKESLAED